MATLSRVLQERLVSDELARLLDQAEAYVQPLPYDSDEASRVRVAVREHERARRVPAELKVEMARAASIGEHVWQEARARSDFQLFLPHLQKNVELNLRYAECIGEEAESLYDPLLDDYEPGMTLSEAKRLLDTLKEAIVPLAAEVAEHADSVDDSCLYGTFPSPRQRDLISRIFAELPLDP